MAAEIDATIRLAMDQGFQGVATMFQQAAARYNVEAGFVSTSMLLSHNLTKQLVGAKAAGNLELEGIADQKSQLGAGQSKPPVVGGVPS